MSEGELLDLKGLLCPEPVMLLRKAMRGLEAGAELSLVATDPSTERDIPKFCTFMGHELVDMHEKDNEYFFTIRKNA